MKISIIVPVYNSSQFIHKLIDSIKKQSYCNYELILVDDGSQDNSYEIIKEYEKKNNNIKSFTKKNSGPGFTRKFGFEKATGDLIYFVDSDDWLPNNNVLEEIVNIFTKQKIDILFFDREVMNNNKRSIRKGFYYLKEGKYNINQIHERIGAGLGSKVFKKNLLSSDMFIESMVYEDLYTTYMYLNKCTQFYYCEKVFYTIYHDDSIKSITKTIIPNRLEKTIDILCYLEKNIKEELKYSNEVRMVYAFKDYYDQYIKNKKNVKSDIISEKIKKVYNIITSKKIPYEPEYSKKFYLLKNIKYKIIIFLYKKKELKK